MLISRFLLGHCVSYLSIWAITFFVFRSIASRFDSFKRREGSSATVIIMSLDDKILITLSISSLKMCNV